MKQNNNTLIFALGGLGEVGKNMYCVEYEDEIIIIDSGVMFPENELLGIDYVIPDFTYLKQNKNKIKSLIITHGHEDHIGSITFLLQIVNIPTIYAPTQATALINKKLDEKNIKYKNLHTYTESTKLKFKNIEVEFFSTTHSIPDSHGISILTPNGRIVMTGDFKFDFTPIGPMANLGKIALIGDKGVSLLMSDSTNALSEGISPSESKVDSAMNEIFANSKDKRIIVATFASNIYRLKHIIEICRKNKRKVALFGRSMVDSVDIAIKFGYIKDQKIIISTEEANSLKPGEVCLLCTGSQGEPLAALSKIAGGSHKFIKLMPNYDVVIFSSSPIPGNTASVNNTINRLYLKGVKVYTDVHTSGHGNKEELKLMLRLIKPKFFAPYHGEYRMLKSHADIGVECGIPKENTFILENGDVLLLNNGIVTRGHKIIANDVYVDGNRIGDIGSAIIKDRKLMSSNGILAVILNINTSNKQLLGRVNVVTRGFIVVKENEELLRDIETKANGIVRNFLTKNDYSYGELKSELITNLASYIDGVFGRTPIILPIIMDIKEKI